MKAIKTENIVDRIRNRVLADPDAAAGYRDQQEIRRLGREIRALRESAKLTQGDLAKMARMTQADLSRLENGLLVRGSTIGTLVRLSSALGFSIALQPAPQAEIVEEDDFGGMILRPPSFELHDSPDQPQQAKRRRIIQEA